MQSNLSMWYSSFVDQSKLQQLQQIATILKVSPVSTDTCTKHGRTTATELEACCNCATTGALTVPNIGDGFLFRAFIIEVELSLIS